MKNTVILTLSLFVAGLFLAASSIGTEMVHKSMDKSLHSANEFIGTEVRDVNGSEIGEVKDLAIDLDRGIIYAAVENEKLMQVDKTILVPLSAFDVTHAEEYVSLPVTKESLTKYPKRDTGMNEETYGRNLHEFYGISYPWGGHEIPSRGKTVKEPLGN